MENSGNGPRWENMNKEILCYIFKKLDVVDVIMGASRVCINWFLASHNKTIWNTIKLNDLDSILFDNPKGRDLQDDDRLKHRYPLRKILMEINKFCPTVPINLFFNVFCSVREEDLEIISTGMPNIRKLALPMWTRTLNLESIKSAFSRWKSLQTLIIAPLRSDSTNALSLELRAIGNKCKNLTTIKFNTWLNRDLADIIVCNFPSLEQVSFRCSYVCVEASMSLIINLPKLKILNLSHCIFTKPMLRRTECQLLGMEPKEELVQVGTKKLNVFMVCSSDCTICQAVWKHRENRSRSTIEELRCFREEHWKTDEIKELEF